MGKQGDVGSYVREQYLLFRVWLKSRISKVASSQQDTSQNEDDCPRTKSGRKVKKPRRYCLKSSFPDGSARPGGEVVIDHKSLATDHESHLEDHYFDCGIRGFKFYTTFTSR